MDRRALIEGRRRVENYSGCNNMTRARRKAGAALTRFLHWRKTALPQETITERSAAQRLESFRREEAHYLGESFAPIMAYGSHGAIVHYSPTEEIDATLLPQSFLFADTGGHYLEGTTDCTRTVSLGPLTSQQKEHHTTELCGHLNLAATHFHSIVRAHV